MRDASMSKKVHNLFEGRLLPLAEKISDFPTLTAIRSALILTLPFMILGSLAELMTGFPLPAYKEFMKSMFGEHWRLFGELLKNGTFSIMSLMMLFSLGHHLAEQFNESNVINRVNPIISGLVGFASFFCLLSYDRFQLMERWFGVSGLFVAIIIGLLSARIFLFLSSIKKLQLYLPGGRPDVATPQAFNVLISAVLTVLIFAGVGTIMRAALGVSVHEAVYGLIRFPFDAIGDGIGRGMLYIFSLQVLWFAGIHGANVLDPITHDVYGAAMAANHAAAAAGLPLPHVMTKSFMDTFVFMGGSGTSICLAVALILFGRNQANRKLGFISVIPGLFNINEILLFGLPIVLNPIMLIPFVGAPLLLAAISYIAVSLGLVPGTSSVTEWTTPILLNGYLSTDSIRGPLLQIFNLCVGVAVYAPFIKLGDKINAKQVVAAFHKLLRRCNETNDSSARRIDRLDDAGSLARALTGDLEYDFKKGEKLFLEFQPQVSSITGRVVGVEALLRWRHSAYGLIPAPITVSLAEDSGLIRPIGLWVFETACRVRRSWLDNGITDLIMAVNFSAIQLRWELPEQLKNILERYSLPPRMLEVEVTESRALDTNTPESKVLARLYEMGFPIAIDDFGMGHSSLKYLKQFPVTAVKIDGAISKEVVTNPICADIVASITRLCRARNMISVVEFVETDKQVEILRAQGCDVFQGYKFSKPLVAEECLAFIRSNHARTEAPSTFSGS